MSVDITALTAEVANNSTVEGSIVTLLNTLGTEIANFPASTDPATQDALNALVATLTQNDAAIAAAVVANTQYATPPAPAPAPAPAPTPPAA